jgi:murein L,D-transpeptidase YafK
LSPPEPTPTPTARSRLLRLALVLALGAATMALLGIGVVRDPTPAVAHTAAPAAVAASARSGRPAGPLEVDALLFRTMQEISANRLGTALTEIDRVIGTYPNFRLAHLIKGDLLLARRQPITTIGNAERAPSARLEDLRQEARVRLARYHHVRPAGQVPRYVLQLNPEQRHALVVDTSRSTLYVFEHRDGALRYVADYYTTIGKNGIEKNREGDQKTPLGVYHVTSSIPRQKLTDFYGAAAFPINYPNEWDRRQGRNGFGIWLHGTPSDTYSRPPRASDGCVVLSNQDLEAIARTVQVGLTPVIIADAVEWVAAGAAGALRVELARQLEGWRADWESLDTDRYLRHYAAEFTSGKMDLPRWAAHKRVVNAGKAWLNVKVDNVSMYLYPGRDDLAVVTFDQTYASSNLENRMRKRQYWIREGGGWRIIHEGAA